MERGKIEESMKKLKVLKTPRGDSITAEMLNIGGGAFVEF